MHVQFMQRVDYWVGIPLCALLSVWHYFAKLLFPIAASTPKKVLFIELSEMGSAILAYSALSRAKGAGWECYFLVFARNKESVEILNIFKPENILVVDDTSFLSFTKSILKNLYIIRKLRIDTVIDCELFSRATSLISYLCGAKTRVGFHGYKTEGLFRGNFLTHKVLYNSHQHMALNFLSLALSLHDQNSPPPLLKKDVRESLLPLPRLNVLGSALTQIKQALNRAGCALNEDTKLVLLNPDPGLLPLRAWPEENFVRLSEELCRTSPQIKIGIIGLKRAARYADLIRAACPSEAVLDLAGETKDLQELLALFSLSKLLVTNDSGPAHVAALSSIHSIVLFGPETPKLYGPLSGNCTTLFANLACSPCYSAFNHRQSTCTDNRCLQAISVEQVKAAALRVLQTTL